MQIKNLVLYNYQDDRKIVPFKLGKLNIITGASKKGKSAIIDIIDYCLGSKECNIAEGIIRRTVKWFGLHLKFKEGEVFVARKNPGPKKNTTSEFYYEVAGTLEIPNKIKTKNTDLNTMISFLSNKLGIADNLHIPSENSTREPLEANIRHAVNFCLQSQDEIASKNMIFHRQNETFKALSIKDTLQYFLGVVKEDDIFLRNELKKYKREFKRVNKRISEEELIKGEEISKADSLLTEAIEVGILNKNDIDNLNKNSIEHKFDLLNKAIVEWSPYQEYGTVSNQLEKLQDELYYLQQKYYKKQDEYNSAEKILTDINSFEFELFEQKSRLKTLDIFPNPKHKISRCPLCHNEFEENRSPVKDIHNSLHKINNELGASNYEIPKVRKYLEEIDREIGKLKRSMQMTKDKINEIFKENKSAKKIKDQNLRQSRVVGRISLFLESVNISNEINELRRLKEEKSEIINHLEEELNEDEIKNKLESVNFILNMDMTNRSKELKLEHGNKPVRLDFNKLTIMVDDENKSIPLYNIGSGENWVSFHILVHLALHKYFVKNSRPVPNFLILDQPTQVYFPNTKKEDLKEDIKNLDDEDIQAVNRLFNQMFDFVDNLFPEFQIVVLDHADLDDSRFQAAISQRWRGEGALIPKEWE